MAVVDTIYKVIDEKCLKQSAVARAAGYEPKVFNAMLRGRKRMTSDDIVPICKALGVTPNELFGIPPAYRPEEERMKKPRRGAGGNGEIMKYEEIMADIKDINGPWSNAACMGYCRMAMQNAGVDECTQRKVLRELEACFDQVSVEEAAQVG